MTTNMYGINGPCNAPWNNMYFTVMGQASPCWKSVGYCDSWSPTRSISDIWNGEKFQEYRDALAKNKFINRCRECEKNINEGVWPLAKAYQNFGINKNGYPTVMELELSNQCNLECTMCSGLLSSGIRKNRDKLPPLKQIYDDSFIEQLKEFVPHLVELRFNGGEPFAQKIVLDICDMVAEINPKLKINIATNGTVYNKRVKHILANNNIHLNISIDSLIPERYQSIRVNGNWDQLMDNFNIFYQYCKDNNRELAIMVNPMRDNWQEMVEFVNWTNTLDVSLWFNTILYPTHLALWNLPTDQLLTIVETLETQLKSISNLSKNYRVIDHFINKQLKTWLLDSYV